jgi:hypothetical protein
MVDTVVEHVDADRPRRPPHHGPIDEFTVRVPAFTPQALTGTWDAIDPRDKAHHTEAASARSLRTSPRTAASCRRRTGSTSSPSAEVVGAARTVGAFVNFGADYLEPGVITTAATAPWCGRDRRRDHAARPAHRDAWRRFDPRAIVDARTSGATCGARKPTARCCSPPR